MGTGRIELEQLIHAVLRREAARHAFRRRRTADVPGADK
jgi:hypothetical protein